MLTGFFIYALVAILAVVTHRSNRLYQKLYKQVPLAEWMNLLIYPLFLYVGWALIAKTMLSRPTTGYFPLADFDIITITFFFIVYSLVGAAIHFTGKILWLHLKESAHTSAYRVNEIFHGKLSHYFVYLGSMFVFFLTPLLEFNHPLDVSLSAAHKNIIFVFGFIAGILASRSVFITNEWFGGYNKPLFFLAVTLLTVLKILQKSYGINYNDAPVNFFVTTLMTMFAATFLLRQAAILMRLTNRRKLRFLMKFLSINQ